MIGTISGIVGAGGNIGAMGFNLLIGFGFKKVMDSYYVIGWIVMLSCVLTFLLDFGEEC
jgi:hypothetical protein